MPLTEHASEISTFATPDNVLQYTVMAFGMCNAPTTFQRLEYTVLAVLMQKNADGVEHMCQTQGPWATSGL